MDKDNFEFTINDGKDIYHFVMINGELIIDDCSYEAAGCPETYALARAYIANLIARNEFDEK